MKKKYNSKKAKQTRLDKKKRGECYYCKKPARPNKITCEHHGKIISKSTMKWRHKFDDAVKNFNLCNQCMKEPKLPTKGYCAICRDYNRERNRISSKLLRQKRLTEGKCTKCGGEKDKETSKWCIGCLDANRPRNRVKVNARIKKINSNREKNKECKRCGKKLVNLRYKNCLNCRNKITTMKRNQVAKAKAI